MGQRYLSVLLGPCEQSLRNRCLHQLSEGMVKQSRGLRIDSGMEMSVRTATQKRPKSILVWNAASAWPASSHQGFKSQGVTPQKSWGQSLANIQNSWEYAEKMR